VQRTIVTVIGDEDLIREQPLEALAGVESVKPILRPYKLVSRDFASGRNRDKDQRRGDRRESGRRDGRSLRR
jgi:hypothetical protein